VRGTPDAMLLAEIGCDREQSVRTKAQQMAGDDKNFPRKMTRQEAGAAGGRGKKKAVDIINSFARDDGTRASYLVRRLKRDRPDIAEALARGEDRSASSVSRRRASRKLLAASNLSHSFSTWGELEATYHFVKYVRPDLAEAPFVQASEERQRCAERVMGAAEHTTLDRILANGGDRKSQQAKSECNLHSDLTRDERAKHDGISKRTQAKLDALARRFPALHEEVKAGRMSCHAAAGGRWRRKPPFPQQAPGMARSHPRHSVDEAAFIFTSFLANPTRVESSSHEG
jgi:hypothetical protein